jgi:hypothetical protein
MGSRPKWYPPIWVEGVEDDRGAEHHTRNKMPNREQTQRASASEVREQRWERVAQGDEEENKGGGGEEGGGGAGDREAGGEERERDGGSGAD